jgi:hypothetical protein
MTSKTELRLQPNVTYIAAFTLEQYGHFSTLLPLWQLRFVWNASDVHLCLHSSVEKEKRSPLLYFKTVHESSTHKNTLYMSRSLT